MAVTIVIQVLGHLVPQLIHIWNLIIRHPDLFYSSRTQFVPQMVNSLNRLGLPINRPLENRKLAVDLVAKEIEDDINPITVYSCHRCLRFRQS